GQARASDNRTVSSHPANDHSTTRPSLLALGEPSHHPDARVFPSRRMITPRASTIAPFLSVTGDRSAAVSAERVCNSQRPTSLRDWTSFSSRQSDRSEEHTSAL